MKKICRICKKLSEHTIRNTGKPYSWCKVCQNKYSQAHYQKNKNEHIKRSVNNSRIKRIKNAQKLNEYKESKPCIDCGIHYPAPVMEFDHIKDKFKNVSSLKGYSWKTIMVEIEKCELVCANCHRMRTIKRANYIFPTT